MSTSILKIVGKLYGFPKKFEKSRASLGKNFEILRRPSIRTDILPKYSVGCPCYLDAPNFYNFDAIVIDERWPDDSCPDDLILTKRKLR